MVVLSLALSVTVVRSQGEGIYDRVCLAGKKNEARAGQVLSSEKKRHHSVRTEREDENVGWSYWAYRVGRVDRAQANKCVLPFMTHRARTTAMSTPACF